MFFGKKEDEEESTNGDMRDATHVQGEIVDDATVDTAMVPLSQAQTALAKVENVEEVKEVRDKAEAARKYILNAGLGLEALNQAAEIKLRAERKAGEMLANMGLHGGNRSRSNKDERLRLEDLGISKDQSSRWQLLARVPEDDFNSFVCEVVEGNEELTTAAALRFARTFRTKPKPKSQSTASTDENLLNEHQGMHDRIVRGETFGCIYASPRWAAESGKSSALATLPIGELAAEKSHLHVWVPDEYIFAAQELITAWGFNYAGIFVWTKPKRGIGKHWKRSHELLLLGVRGDCEFQSKTASSWITANPPRGGRKPARIRSLIESVSPGPFLELFCDTAAKGWACCPLEDSEICKPVENTEYDNVETTNH